MFAIFWLAYIMMMALLFNLQTSSAVSFVISATIASVCFAFLIIAVIFEVRDG